MRGVVFDEVSQDNMGIIIVHMIETNGQSKGARVKRGGELANTNDG